MTLNMTIYRPYFGCLNIILLAHHTVSNSYHCMPAAPGKVEIPRRSAVQWLAPLSSPPRANRAGRWSSLSFHACVYTRSDNDGQCRRLAIYLTDRSRMLKAQTSLSTDGLYPNSLTPALRQGNTGICELIGEAKGGDCRDHCAPGVGRGRESERSASGLMLQKIRHCLDEQASDSV